MRLHISNGSLLRRRRRRSEIKKKKWFSLLLQQIKYNNSLVLIKILLDVNRFASLHDQSNSCRNDYFPYRCAAETLSLLQKPLCCPWHIGSSLFALMHLEHTGVPLNKECTERDFFQSMPPLFSMFIDSNHTCIYLCIDWPINRSSLKLDQNLLCLSLWVIKL